MNVGLYSRVSTFEQQTLTAQLDAMRDYAKKRKWKITLEVKDVGSGASDRPKREILIQAARRHEIDAILVKRLDRWGRSLADLVLSLKELDELGIGFVSLCEAIDLTTPTGRALAGLLAVFAQFEREILCERVKAGIAHARSKGRPHGRPKTAYRHAQTIRELDLEGQSKAEISRKVGIGRTSVRRILENRPLMKEIDALIAKKPKTIRIRLYLRVENNSKYVRGKKKVREEIERFCLRQYDMQKPFKDGDEYQLVIPYMKEEELDEIINDLSREMESIADARYCFTETAFSAIDSDRTW